MKKVFQLLVIIIILSTGCEEQAVIVPEFTAPETGRVVLVEELTGVSCPNCPAGIAVINFILDEFDGNVVTYGVHGLNQTKPKDDSKYDFRNDDAIDLEESLKPFFGKPAAAINRVLFSGQDHVSNTSRDLWPSMVEQELLKPQQLAIFLDSSFDEDTRTATINVGVKAIIALAGELQVHVSITESHLIDPQDDVNRTIPDYEHNHVLKDILTQLNGDVLTTDITANEIINRTYQYTVPDELNGEWIPENMEIVAFVTSSSNGGEVLQAATIYLK
ncbi:MAG: Omp28-related outer membrane protein [Saprospiraceae bacterium]|nr:Omp28-related outer membrane protein [Saprospiraceae bacterium]